MEYLDLIMFAALMGAIKIESHGTQNHSLDPDDFRERYRAFLAECEELAGAQARVDAYLAGEVEVASRSELTDLADKAENMGAKAIANKKPISLRSNERPTPNAECPTSNKVFCRFIKGRSAATTSFDVQCSMFIF